LRYHGTNCNSRSRVGPGDFRWLLFSKKGGRAGTGRFRKKIHEIYTYYIFAFPPFFFFSPVLCSRGCWWHKFSYFDKLSYTFRIILVITLSSKYTNCTKCVTFSKILSPKNMSWSDHYVWFWIIWSQTKLAFWRQILQQDGSGWVVL